MTHLSKEQKQQLITAYEASGLSISKWCKENQISTSTFSYWRRSMHWKNNQNEVYGNEDTSFVEISFSDTANASTNEIVIEHGDFKVKVTKQTDMSILSGVLKVVKQANV